MEVAGPLGTPLGLAQQEEGLTSRGGSNLRLPLRFGLRPQGPCRVGTGQSGLVLSDVKDFIQFAFSLCASWL